MNDHKKRRPFLKTWRNVYAFVIIVLALIILFLYFFTQHYK